MCCQMNSLHQIRLPLKNFSHAGEAPSTRREWLAEVIIALLQRAQELGLADWAAQRSRITEGLAVPEGLAWRECFAAFFTLLARHLATLLEVGFKVETPTISPIIILRCAAVLFQTVMLTSQPGQYSRDRI